MSHIYKIGSGWGLAEVALAPFVYQPRCELGVVAAQRDIAADGSVVELGLHATLEWAVIDGEDQLQEILEQADLESNYRSQVTLTLPDYERIGRRYNAWLVRPQNIRYRGFPIDLVMMANRLTLLG